VCERNGRSAILIATDAFAPPARAEAAVLGMPDARIVEIPHPLAGAGAQQIVEYAGRLVHDILALVASESSLEGP
jgi:hypothetical protein